MNNMNDHLNNRLSDLLNLEHAEETFQDRKNGLVPVESAKEQKKQKENQFEPTGALVEYEAKELVVKPLDDAQNQSDRELARASIRNVIEQSNENLGALFMIAKMSEHPRMFEVAATIAKTIIDASSKLDDMASDGKKGATGQGAPTGVQNTQNNYYMSSEEAMKIARERKANRNAIQNPAED